MKISSLLIFIQFSFYALSSFAQKPELSFKHITSLNGLSEGFTKNTIMDYQGFIWIATINGLNKYDGYNITVFKNSPEDSTSLTSSNTRYVFEDSFKNLWIATNDGVELYNRDKDNFIHFPETKKEFIRCIMEDRNKDLWLSAEGAIFKYERKAKKFKKLTFPGFNAVVEYLYEDSNQNLWMGTVEGVASLDKTRTQFTIHDEIKIKNIYAILEDSQKQLWFGSRGDGIVILDPKRKSQKILQQDLTNKNSISSNKILSLFEDSVKQVWIGTEHGSLCIFQPKTNTFHTYEFNEADNESLLHNSIYSIYKDRNSNIWLSCFGGVEMMIYKKFVHIRKNSLLKQSLSHNNVLCFYEDKQGLIWVGTDGGGVNIWNRKTNEFTVYKHDPKNPRSLGSNAVLAIEEGDNGKMWIATWGGGLNLFDPTTKEFTRYLENPKDPKSILSSILYGLYKDKNNDLWAVTLLGLDFYDKKTNSFIHYNIPKTGLTDLIGGMYEDKEGNFWVGSFNGLYILNKDTKTVKAFPHKDDDPNSISNDQINSIREDRKGNLWISTTTGFNLYNKGKGNFTVLNKKDGLPGDMVNGFLEDKSGKYWISTGSGISVYNPETKKFRNYNVSDGLQGNSFSIHALYQLKSGEMLFGGANGFNIIDPERIHENKSLPPVVTTDFKIFNESIDIDGKESPLNKHISLTKELTLSYKQSVISFDFAALNYRASDKNQYAYILEGLETKWNYVGDKRSATYTSLDPGEYVFKVKASNNDGFWNEQGTTLKIIVEPPYWQTWWFKSLIALVLIGSLVSFYIIRMNRVKAQKAALERLVQERTAEVVHQKEELQSQAENLQEANNELHQQQKEILEQRHQIEEQHSKLEETNKKVMDSIQYAKSIQKAILPSSKKIEEVLREHFILYRPKDVVSGDFYWFTHLPYEEIKGKHDTDVTFIAAIDCTGHGVPGAFMSIIGNTLLNEIINLKHILNPAEILEELDKGVMKAVQKTEGVNTAGMDVCLLRIERGEANQYKISYSGAKRPLYCRRKNSIELEILEGDRRSIGALKFDTPFTTQEMIIEEGTTFYLVSDGYTDQNNPTREKLGSAKLKEVISNVYHLPLAEQVKVFETTLDTHQQDAEQRDDITLIGIRV